MGCFQVRYDYRVVIYECKLFITLSTGEVKHFDFCPVQCDHIGRFLKSFDDFFSFFFNKKVKLIMTFGVKVKKNTLVPVKATFGKTRATFYFNIWSH